MSEVLETAPAAGVATPARRSSLLEIFRYRQLIAMLVVRELKVRYKRSLFGLLWTMLNPLLLMIVYTVVFATIMKAPQRNFSIFLLSGLLPWLYFSTAVLQGLTSILTNQELIRKVRLPQAVFPLSVVGSNLVNFALSLLPLLLLMRVMGQPYTPALLFLPLAMLILTLFISGVTLLFSTFTVFFRDVRHLAEVALQMLGQHDAWWFRAFRMFLRVNPLWYLLELVRDPVYYGRLPPSPAIGIAVISALVSLFVGFTVFRRLSPRHIHYL